MRTFAFSTLFAGCLIASGALAAQEGTPLFNGRNLDGWKASENPGTFKVEDGAIVAHGPRAHLFYTGTVNGASFKNFELSVEVRAPVVVGVYPMRIARFVIEQSNGSAGGAGRVDGWQPARHDGPSPALADQRPGE